jgi:formiminotetrahydrofolate cyclodeaminase
MEMKRKMPELDEIKDELMATVESDVDAWESFYQRYKEDYAKIARYEKKIERLQEQLKDSNSVVKRKLERERGTLLLATGAFIVVAAFFLQIISTTLNVWLYFLGGLLIGLGAFSLLYLWTR